MFKNVGRKIKILAKVFFWIGIICSVLLAVGIAVGGDDALNLLNGKNPGVTQDTNNTVVCIIVAVVVLIVGFLGAWLESLFVYGFGELIDNTTRIRRRLSRHSEDEYDM